MMIVFNTPKGRKKPPELRCTLPDDQFNELVRINGLPDWNQHYRYVGHFPVAALAPTVAGDYAIVSKP